MGATILYTPISTRRAVKGGSTSAWEKTKRVFGDSPSLGESDLSTLRALALADEMYADYWNALAALVAQHGALSLDAEF